MSTEFAPKTSRKSQIGCVVLGLACLLVVGSLLASSVKSARSAARRASCTCHLKQVGLALLNYESTYRRFPPAYLADADGKPMHSWRVLILPYLERQDLYKRYDFSEPWDGPNNKRLHGEIETVFRCPEATGPETETSYVAVVGDETAWPGAESVRIRDIRDGTSKTIAIVEVANSGIHWMEPRDLTFDEALRGINPPGPGPKISSHHVGGAMVGWLDAHVSLLPDDLPVATLRALLTRSGKEPVSDPTQ
jgi:hypothetical protein